MEKILSSSLFVSIAFLAFSTAETAQAQPAGQAAEDVEEILVVGSRRRDR